MKIDCIFHLHSTNKRRMIPHILLIEERGSLKTDSIRTLQWTLPFMIDHDRYAAQLEFPDRSDQRMTQLSGSRELRSGSSGTLTPLFDCRRLMISSR